jgi:Holliday junction resolvase RusA-like endonuclease
MKILFDQIPMPPSENQLYATDWKTNRRFESKESAEYKLRFRNWALKRFEHVAKIQEQLKWELGDHRRMIRVDAYFFFQYSSLFTKPVKKMERPRRKRMDVSNKCKALYDCLSNMLQVDDCRFYPGVALPVMRSEPTGQYVMVSISLDLIETEADFLPGLKAKFDTIY